MSRADFRGLVSTAVAEASGGAAVKRQLVEREILHYDILHAMAHGGFLDHLVFHGGTALRICHGGARLSEDLDFCAGPGFTDGNAAELGPMLQHFLEARYGLETRISQPKKRDFETVNVRRWWVRMEPIPARRSHGSDPWVRVKLEIADMDEQAVELTRLGRNYRVIPDSHADTRVRVATMNGILADKLVAFPERLPVFVRWRDIWDMHWLMERGVSVDTSLVRAKLAGYGIRNFDGRLAEASRQLPGLLSSGQMAAKLEDFVPQSIAERTLRDDRWLEKAATGLQELLEGLRKDLGARDEPGGAGVSEGSVPSRGKEEDDTFEPF